MSNKYNLSPTEKLNYVEKGSVKGQGLKIFKQLSFSFIIIVVLILIIIPYLKNHKKRQDLNSEIAKVQEEIIRYEKSNEDLKGLLSYLDSSQAVEDRARINLGLQKEGENVVVIKRKEVISDNQTISQKDLKDISNFKKWIKYFFEN